MKFRCLLVVGALVLAFVVPDLADAGLVDRKFRGQIVITKKRPPARFKSQGRFVSWLRRNRTRHVGSRRQTKKSWKFEFMAFFRQKLDDLEVKIRFFDITEGKKFIAADTFYIPNRGQRVLASNMQLEKPRFAVNRKYLMEVISPRRGLLLARTTFYLIGQQERYSGKVTFTEEEARLR